MITVNIYASVGMLIHDYLLWSSGTVEICLHGLQKYYVLQYHSECTISNSAACVYLSHESAIGAH